MMKGTACPIIIAAPLEFYISADNFYDIILFLELADEVLKVILIHTLPSLGTNNFLNSPIA